MGIPPFNPITSSKLSLSSHICAKVAGWKKTFIHNTLDNTSSFTAFLLEPHINASYRGCGGLKTIFYFVRRYSSVYSRCCQSAVSLFTYAPEIVLFMKQTSDLINVIHMCTVAVKVVFVPFNLCLYASCYNECFRSVWCSVLIPGTSINSERRD